MWLLTRRLATIVGRSGHNHAMIGPRSRVDRGYSRKNASRSMKSGKPSDVDHDSMKI